MAQKQSGGLEMIEIIIAVITGICSISGVVISAQASSRKLQQQLEISQAVMQTKIENLTAEVRMHNEFARRMPVMEEQIKALRHKIERSERDDYGK